MSRGVAQLVSTCAVAVLVAMGGAGVIAACTTFDGLSASDDGGVDASSDRATVVGDAAPEAAALPSYLSPSEAARACSLVFRCPLLASSVITSVAVPVDPTNYALCMDWLAGPLPPNRVGIPIQASIFQCIASATTCGAAAACVPIENFLPGDPRCADAGAGDAGKERCADDGGTVLRCAELYALHCGSGYYAPGSACMKGLDNSHWCALNPNCTTQSSCLGTVLDYCGAGSKLHEGINCAASGYTCGINPEAGAPDCLTDTTIKLCVAPGADCAGESVVVCDGYQESIFDCAAMGAACSKKSGPARCGRPSDTCSTFDSSVNACNGSTIALCLGGQPLSFDCASVSLSCKPAAGAKSAHCG